MCHYKSGCCKTPLLQHDRMVWAPIAYNITLKKIKILRGVLSYGQGRKHEFFAFH
jgi:hypothetical protein